MIRQLRSLYRVRMSTVTCTLAVLSVLMTITQRLHAQCTCMGGAAVGGISPIAGTANVGLLEPAAWRIVGAYRYGFGDGYMRGDAHAEPGPVRYYRMHYTSLTAAHGLGTDLTLEAELGAYPRKSQHFGTMIARGGGLSHVMLGAKFGVWQDDARDVECTVGAGVRMPLTAGSTNLPQHILPSTGAWGGSAQLLLRRGFPAHRAQLVLVHRSDMHARNASAYRYGSGFLTSLFGVASVNDAITGVVELRHEYRMRDRFHDLLIDDSGGHMLVFSPQLGIAFGPLAFGINIDLPLLRFYNGHQLAQDLSAGCTITWQPTGGTH